MRLRYSPTSPYARKVVATAIERGLADRIEIVATNPWDPASDLSASNPLGKVPALLLDDGTVLFDSPVICEYLDSLPGSPGLFPPPGEARWSALRLQALADGILDAAVLRLLESKRDAARQSPEWMDRQATAIGRALDLMEREVGRWPAEPTIGQLTAGCALGYLDLRFAADDWRATHPELAVWYETFSQRESMRKTQPPPG